MDGNRPAHTSEDVVAPARSPPAPGFSRTPPPHRGHDLLVGGARSEDGSDAVCSSCGDVGRGTIPPTTTGVSRPAPQRLDDGRGEGEVGPVVHRHADDVDVLLSVVAAMVSGVWRSPA